MSKLRDLLLDVAKAHGMTAEDIRGGRKRGAQRARYEFCYLAATDTEEPIRAVAQVAGFADWTSVTYGVRQHAIRNGFAARSFMDARKGVQPHRMVNWHAVAAKVEAHIVAGPFTQVAIAKRAGVSRRVISWVTQAKPISADDLIAILVSLDIRLEEIVTEPLRARLHPAQP